MKMLRAYKTELNPNNKQRTTFLRYSGAARFAFNWGLARAINEYKATKKHLSGYTLMKEFNARKDAECPWVREIAYRVYEEAIHNVGKAYDNFFRRVKNGETEAGFPKFKSRENGIGSFTLRASIIVEPRRIKLPKIGWVRLCEKRYIPDSGRIMYANVSERAGRWFVSVLIEQEVPEPTPQQGPPVGVDVGIKSLAVCSNGRVFENPRSTKRHEKQLGRLNRELHRRQKGSHNREKTKQRIARLHYKIACVRRDAIHHATKRIVARTKPAVIVVEDLHVKGMVKNGHLSKAVSDASMSELHRQLAYKAAWRGSQLLVADRWFPSSKTCSNCGSVRAELGLDERIFVCDDCGFVIDRDENASRNLAALAVKPTVIACGVGVL